VQRLGERIERANGPALALPFEVPHEPGDEPVGGIALDHNARTRSRRLDGLGRQREISVGPICMIPVDAVAAVGDHQPQGLCFGDGNIHRFGRVAPLQNAGTENLVAIGPDFERHGAADGVVRAHDGVKTVACTVEREDHLAAGVRAQPVGIRFPGNGHRFSGNRQVELALAPVLRHGLRAGWIEIHAVLFPGPFGERPTRHRPHGRHASQADRLLSAVPDARLKEHATYPGDFADLQHEIYLFLVEVKRRSPHRRLPAWRHLRRVADRPARTIVGGERLSPSINVDRCGKRGGEDRCGRSVHRHHSAISVETRGDRADGQFAGMHHDQRCEKQCDETCS